MWRNSTKLLFQTVISVHTFNQPLLLWMLQTINPVTLELHCVYDQIWLFCLVSKGQSCIINKAVKEKLYLKKNPKTKTKQTTKYTWGLLQHHTQLFLVIYNSNYFITSTLFLHIFVWKQLKGQWFFHMIKQMFIATEEHLMKNFRFQAYQGFS